MQKAARFIVGKRKLIFLITIILLVFSVISTGWVKVEQELEAYLPADSDTRTGLDIMKEDFVTYGSADFMVENIIYEDARKLSEEIGKMNGVQSVGFDNSSDHYNNASALFSVTFDYSEEDGECLRCLDEIKEYLSPYDVYVSTSLGNQEGEIIEQEVSVIILILAGIVLAVTVLTSETYAEVAVLLITFITAIFINKGTNFLLGKISFVSNSVTAILQLALSLDYAIILCNRFKEEHKTLEIEDAAVAALSKAIPEIGASCLTTIGGLVAMLFMKFRIGSDMAICLIKAILLSLLSVFLLMPGLLVLFGSLIDKTKHRKFIPDVSFIGKFDYKTRHIVPIVFVVLVAVGFIFSGKCPYVYGYGSIKTPRTNFVQEAEKKIAENFTSSEMVAIVLPEKDHEKEKALLAQLESFEEVDHAQGLANTAAMDEFTLTDRISPRQFAELTDIDYELSKIVFGLYTARKGAESEFLEAISSEGIPLMDLITFVAEIADTGLVELDDEKLETIKDAADSIAKGRAQLESEDRSRVLVYLNLKSGYDSTYEFLDTIQELSEAYYGGKKVYLVGSLTTEYDFKKAFAIDNITVTAISIIIVLVVLLFTFKSVGMPILLILIIQGSIWINFAIPFVINQPLFFMSYLIVSAIQMGANIDYAIVIASRFTESKEKMSLKDAVCETVNFAFPTVLTSGTILALAGILIGNMTSEATIVGIGQCIGRGTIISMILVLFVLPQILVLGNKIIEKTSFDVKKIKLGSLAVAAVLSVVFVFAGPHETAYAAQKVTVSTVEDLVDLADACSLDTYSKGLTVELTNDLSLEETDFDGIPAFSGTFKGNGHRISGFTITEDVSDTGFFGRICEGGVVLGLTVSGEITPEGKSSGIGGIAGINEGTIKNCTFEGTVSAHDEAGGIAGINEETGVISLCRSDGNVRGINKVGGIAGRNNGRIEKCNNLAYVNTDKRDPKVNLSEISFTTMEDILNIGSLETINVPEDIGGIAGYSAGSIEDCNNTSIVGYKHIGYNIGGIAGRSCGHICSCQNSGSIYGRKDIGGITGQAEPYVSEEESSDPFAKSEEELRELKNRADRTGDDIDAASEKIHTILSEMIGSLGMAEVILDEMADDLSDSVSVKTDEINEVGDDIAYMNGKVYKASSEMEEVSAAVDAGLKEYEEAISCLKDRKLNEAADALSRSAAELKKAGESLGDAISDVNSISEYLDDKGIVHFSDDTYLFDRNADELSDAIEGFLDQADVLNDELLEAEKTVSNDADSISEQTENVYDSVKNAGKEISDGLNTPLLEDVSDAETEGTAGRIEKSRNYGHVEGDINTGGIAGSMDLEKESDPEDDYSVTTESLQKKYRLKVVLSADINYGEITGKKDCVGCICAREMIGTIVSCEGYGKAKSINGSYIGGIAGLGNSVIRNSCAKAFLSGKKYVGGIIGSGNSEEEDTSSLVADCVSMVEINDDCRYKGAISGNEKGTFTGNVFVKSALRGLGRNSYEGIAEPVSYEKLMRREDIPDKFRTMKLSFFADGKSVKTVTFAYGQSFDADIFPDVPAKEEMSGRWDREELRNLTFDTEVNAVYERYTIAIGSEASRNDGRRVFVVEGSFKNKDVPGAEKTDSSSLDTEDVHTERWTIRIPQDGNDVHYVRFLPPSEKTESGDIRIYQISDGIRTELETRKAGSYVRFAVTGDEADILMTRKQRSSHPEVFIIVLAVVTGLFIAGIVILVLRGRKSKKSPEEAAEKTNGSHSGRIKFRIVCKWLLFLLIGAAVIVVAWLYSFKRPLLRAGAHAAAVLKEYAASEEYDSVIDVTLGCGTENYRLTLNASKQKSSGKDVYGIDYEGLKLYICDGIIYLPDGRGFDAGMMNPGKLKVTEYIIDAIRNGNISVEEDDGNTIYTVDTEENDTMIAMLLRDMSGIDAQTDSLKISLTVSEKKLKTIHIVFQGTEKQSGEAVVLDATCRAREASSAGNRLPDKVAEAVKAGHYTAAEVSSEKLTELLRGMIRLLSAEKISADVTVDAVCGPLVVSAKDHLRYSPGEEGKDSYCRNITEAILAQIYSIPGRNGLQIVEETENGISLYRIKLSESDIEELILTVLPKAEDMDISVEDGEAVVKMQDGKVIGTTVRINGNVVVVGNDTPVRISFSGLFK